MPITVWIAIAVVALGAVLLPLLRKDEVRVGPKLSDEQLDEQIRTYRSALRNDTLCERCLYANPAKSRYCADCGRVLRG